jgi:DnaJ-class molecular chaperone
MKLFLENNHYELLEISPDASSLEIRQAYRKIYDIYQDEAIASYSFFSEKERKEILSHLDEAYLTLSDPDLRKAYDRSLIELGVLEEKKQVTNKKKGSFPIYQFKKINLAVIGPNKGPDELKNRASQNQVIQNILAQDTITGMDLKKIRTELKISLEEISESTNVNISMLRAIEEEDHELLLPTPIVYIKGFVKSYLRHLQIPGNVFIEGFIKRIEEGKQI